MHLRFVVVLVLLNMFLFADEAFHPMFNGRDLSGWHVVGSEADKNPWTIKDGTVTCTGKSRGWLSSDKEYENFVLRFEYRIPPGGNNGVWLRCPEVGRQSRLGYEFQILDDHGKPATKGSTGSVYDCIPPKKNMSKPAGEWNHVEIMCKGAHVVHIQNGEKIIDVNFDDERVNAELPETHKLNKRQRKGHIGLSNHGTVCEFRNMMIKDL